MSTPGAVLVGIGNAYRREDGIGPALAAAVERLGRPGVSVTVCDGEPSQLLEAWAGARLAVVVDAMLCDVPVPRRIHRSVMGEAPGAVAAQDGVLASTHGLGVPEAIRLAEALDCAPARLVVFAVEAADIGFGPGLSAPVAGCLPELTRAVLAELATGPAQ